MRKENGSMSFRNLHGFNLFMLGKQGWNFILRPHATITKIFKAKYFPNGGFLDAKLGHQPSYTWCSIFASHVLVKDGVKWRIGDASSINLWTNMHPFIPTSPPLGLENLMVSTLINHTHQTWRHDISEQIFDANVSRNIASMSLLNLHDNDAMIWRLTKSGEYSVKSAYHHLMESMTNNDHLKVNGDWNLVRNLQVPPKVKHFIWKILTCCLPMRCNLRSKGVTCPIICSYCECNPENEFHILVWACVQRIWEAAMVYGQLLLMMSKWQNQQQHLYICHLLEKLQSQSLQFLSEWMHARRRLEN